MESSHPKGGCPAPPVLKCVPSTSNYPGLQRFRVGSAALGRVRSAELGDTVRDMLSDRDTAAVSFGNQRRGCRQLTGPFRGGYDLIGPEGDVARRDRSGDDCPGGDVRSGLDRYRPDHRCAPPDERPLGHDRRTGNYVTSRTQRKQRFRSKCPYHESGIWRRNPPRGGRLSVPPGICSGSGDRKNGVDRRAAGRTHGSD